MNAIERLEAIRALDASLPDSFSGSQLALMEAFEKAQDQAVMLYAILTHYSEGKRERSRGMGRYMDEDSRDDAEDAFYEHTRASRMIDELLAALRKGEELDEAALCSIANVRTTNELGFREAIARQFEG
jgi:hypothetical protein